MEMSGHVDQSLERASRILELTNVEAIAQAERQRLTANIRLRRLPGFFLPWHKGGDNIGAIGYWESFKLIALAVVALYPNFGSYRLAVFVSALCAVVALLTLFQLAAARLSRGIAWRELAVKALLLPLKIVMPGFILADFIAYHIVKRWIARLGLGEPLLVEECEKEIEQTQKRAPSELVRGHAVAEIEKIKVEIVGPTSALAKAERELEEGFDEAEALRLRVLHRLTRTEGARRRALEQGMELAKKRVANLRKALARHRDVMARSRAILDECRASAEGLGEAVEDSELLGRLEAGEAEDERRIALSELVMDQAVGQLRNRVMSLEGVLAQLETPKISQTSGARAAEAEQSAYLERIEIVAEQLAAI